MPRTNEQLGGQSGRKMILSLHYSKTSGRRLVLGLIVLFAAVCVWFVAILCCKRPSNINASKLIGTWRLDLPGGQGQWTFTFRPDHTYTWATLPSFDGSVIIGSWKVNADALELGMETSSNRFGADTIKGQSPSATYRIDSLGESNMSWHAPGSWSKSWLIRSAAPK